jgi:hypothetical protein
MVEIQINEKKYHFRDTFMVLDFCHIGVPLVDIEKFRDKVTNEVIIDVLKMEPRDMEAMSVWTLKLMSEINTDKIDWAHSPEIGDYNAIIADPKFQTIRDLYIRKTIPTAIKMSPPIESLPEKKKNP